VAAAKLNAFIERFVGRRLFIDIGAGNGQLTSWIASSFDTTVLVEPNRAQLLGASKHLSRGVFIKARAQELQNECRLFETADFILFSHVLFHIDVADWLNCLRTATLFLRRGGFLCLILQTESTGCRDFWTACGITLPSLSTFLSLEGLAAIGLEVVDISSVPSEICTSDPSVIPTVSEFLLNTSDKWGSMDRIVVESNMARTLARRKGRYFLSCDQEIVLLRKH
jgi:hypothetical protein